MTVAIRLRLKASPRRALAGENLEQTRSVAEDPPTTLLGFFQHAAAGSSDKEILLIGDPVANRIHGLGHFVRRMTSHVLAERSTEDLAPRFASPPRETLDLLEDFIGDGNSGFHTWSITKQAPRGVVLLAFCE